MFLREHSQWGRLQTANSAPLSEHSSNCQFGTCKCRCCLDSAQTEIFPARQSRPNRPRASPRKARRAKQSTHLLCCLYCIQELRTCSPLRNLIRTRVVALPLAQMPRDDQFERRCRGDCHANKKRRESAHTARSRLAMNNSPRHTGKI